MTDFGASSYRRYRSDPQALEELIRTYSDPLVRYAYCFVRDSAAAEDIMEETFVALLYKAPRLPSENALRAWLYKVARNKATDHLRRHKQFVPLADYENIVDASDLEAEFVKKQRDRAVFACLQSLPPQYREVLVLTYYDGLDTQQVSKILGKKVKQVYNLLNRARTSLKELLIKEGISHENL